MRSRTMRVIRCGSISDSSTMDGGAPGHRHSVVNAVRSSSGVCSGNCWSSPGRAAWFETPLPRDAGSPWTLVALPLLQRAGRTIARKGHDVFVALGHVSGDAFGGFEEEKAVGPRDFEGEVDRDAVVNSMSPCVMNVRSTWHGVRPLADGEQAQLMEGHFVNDKRIAGPVEHARLARVVFAEQQDDAPLFFDRDLVEGLVVNGVLRRAFERRDGLVSVGELIEFERVLLRVGEWACRTSAPGGALLVGDGRTGRGGKPSMGSAGESRLARWIRRPCFSRRGATV